MGSLTLPVQPQPQPPQPFQRAQFDLLSDQQSTSFSTIRSIRDLIHHNALHNPNHLFCIQCKQSINNNESQPGTVRVTFGELEAAVDYCCQWVLKHIPGVHVAELLDDGSVQKSRPVALFMESDVNLFVYIAALLSLNIPCLLLSVRLNAAAVRHLLGETGATTIITTPRTRPNIEDALAGGDEDDGLRVTLENAASVEHMLSQVASKTRHSLDENAHRQAVREDDRNVLILHSSGTTGLPKAIPLAHRYVLGYAACHLFSPDEDMSTRGVNLSTLPLFHGFGALAPCLALSVGMPVCFPPSSTIANCHLVDSILKAQDIRSLMTVPSILEDFTLMSDFTAAAKSLAKLNFVACGGGGLKLAVGLALESKNVTLLNHFGATELGALAPIFQPGSDYDWRYLRVRSDLGLEFEIADPVRRSCKLIGYPFAWNSRFELQDRLEYNSLNKSEVKILGRNDDLLVLATGEKVLPYPLEQAMEQHPLIRRAIAFGNGQFELGILIEPMNEQFDFNAFIEEIWPSVLAANLLMDSQAWISTKSAILIKPTDKSIPLSDKGSPQRKEVYDTFAAEIAEVYSMLEGSQANGDIAPFDFENVEETLRNMVQACLSTYNKPTTFNSDEDFVNMGMDSLKATKLRRMLNTSIRKSNHSTLSCRDLPSDFVYAHPSVSRLARKLQEPSDQATPVHDIMRAMVAGYEISTAAASHEIPSQVFLLTGTTGNLGAHLLARIAHLDSVKTIFCLLRSQIPSSKHPNSSLVTRQLDAFKERGIQVTEKAWSKIQLRSWSAGQDYLGLDDHDYQLLASQVTHIFHGAWPMDFKLRIESFEPQIRAVRDLIELARLARRKRPYMTPRLLLASSIAAVGCYSEVAKSGAVVPEVPMEDPAVTLPIGYAHAKWCCEKVIESAYTTIHHEIEPMVIRIGQLSGSQATGFWSHKEHIPALVKACQEIGAVPDLRGTLSWMPVDRAAQVVSELMLNHGPTKLFYHLENPMRQSWADLCTVLENELSIPIRQRVNFQEWLDRVTACEHAVPDLMEFFQTHFLHMSSGTLVLDMKHSLATSQTLRSSGSVRFDAVKLYLDFWRQKGFFN